MLFLLTVVAVSVVVLMMMAALLPGAELRTMVPLQGAIDPSAERRAARSTRTRRLVKLVAGSGA